MCYAAHMSFQWPTKGRVRAIIALSVTGAAIAQGLVTEQVFTLVLGWYFIQAMVKKDA